MKKIFALVLALILALGILSACGKSNSITIAVPNDTTNEARALLLLQDQGYIKLKDGAGITATVNDIAENPLGIKFQELDAAQIPNVLKDVDYAVINSNFAISAGLNPVKDSLAIEGSSSAYANILAVKEGTESTDSVKALKAALESKQVEISSRRSTRARSSAPLTTPPTASTLPSITTRWPERPSPSPLLPRRMPRFWPSSRTFWPRRASPSTFWNSAITSSRTTSSRAARSMPTTSSICPIWRTSTPRTARTSCPSRPSTLSRWGSTAASRLLSTH